jgi:hypothetical protein
VGEPVAVPVGEVGSVAVGAAGMVGVGEVGCWAIRLKASTTLLGPVTNAVKANVAKLTERITPLREDPIAAKITLATKKPSIPSTLAPRLSPLFHCRTHWRTHRTAYLNVMPSGCSLSCSWPCLKPMSAFSTKAMHPSHKIRVSLIILRASILSVHLVPKTRHI